MTNIKNIAHFPHCDEQVLHRPGTCVFCDKYEYEQVKRRLDGINYTGENQPDLKPCPSDAKRGLAGTYVWPGNQPKTEGSWIDNFFDEKCPDCGDNLKAKGLNEGGGVVCTKCYYWFCY